MFSINFLVFIINAKICWSYMVLPFEDLHQVPLKNPSFLKDVGEPLILTPYLKSNQTSEARELSSVESLLSDENIVSNSGFFTVDEKYNSNLFFWFFRKSSSDWHKAPLILWLQGGPGCSSLYGLFEENGPFTFTVDGLKKRNYSWTNDYNVIYIDQPVGTGFSFTESSDGLIGNQEQVADHLYEALTQFFLLYPELKGNAFYVSGESYAGRYIPAISNKIHKLKMANLTDINLKGLFMISPSTEGSYDGLANFCFEIGIIDSSTRTKLKADELMIESNRSSGNWDVAFGLINGLLVKIITASGVNNYDYTRPYARIEENYRSFLNDTSIRKKIHVGNKWHDSCPNIQVYKKFREDFAKSVVPWVEELVDHYPVAFVGGQFDVIVAYPLVLNVMEKLKWNGASKYKSAKRRILGGRNLDGYIKSAGNLKDILIRNAGHMVPGDQPRASLDLLHKFVNGEL